MNDFNTYYQIVEENGNESLVAEPAMEYGISKLYTYADYLLFKVEERIELIKGRVLKMGAPNIPHQSISMNLSNLFFQFLKNKPCKVFAAPVDVRLPVKNKKKDDEIFTVVQPDIMVVCDETKLDKRGICGAPELLIEIISKGNSKRDVEIKFDLYEEAKVLEYWIVYPESRTVIIYNLVNDKFIATKPFTEEGVITSKTLTGFEIEVEEIFKGLKMDD